MHEANSFVLNCALDRTATLFRPQSLSYHNCRDMPSGIFDFLSVRNYNEITLKVLTLFMTANWTQRQKPFQMRKFASGYLVILSDLETAAPCLPIYNVRKISLNRQLTAIRKQCGSTEMQTSR